MEENARSIDQVREKIERAATLVPSLRCAIPKQEYLTASSPIPQSITEATIIAADGSQINPDRHGAFDYCLVNVGAILLEADRLNVPKPVIQTRLFYDDELYTSTGVMTEGIIALIRDQREREVLAEIAQDAKKPVITFTDGPIELWEGEQSREFSQRFQRYLRALSHLHELGAITAGYVEKPRSDLVVRMLEVIDLPDEGLERAGKERLLRGVRDTDLYSDYLGPGDRSAIFEIQSKSAPKYEAELSLHFFYLNVSPNPENPWLVRVEIPAWVGKDETMLDQLHRALMDQCSILGNQPYPYLLHRAHEIALVTKSEKDQLEQMIAIELRSKGVVVARKSPKQVHKDHG
ncbi:MAG: DNA double-strand break repair nuclease NurA [Anaerolineales bacterium]